MARCPYCGSSKVGKNGMWLGEIAIKGACVIGGIAVGALTGNAPKGNNIAGFAKGDMNNKKYKCKTCGKTFKKYNE